MPPSYCQMNMILKLRKPLLRGLIRIPLSLSNAPRLEPHTHFTPNPSALHRILR